MTVDEAYTIACKEYPLSKVQGCLDFGDFFSFALVPMNIDDDEDYFSGTTLTSVNKHTGEVFEYDITSNLDAYENAKQVDITTIYDKKNNHGG